MSQRASADLSRPQPTPPQPRAEPAPRTFSRHIDCSADDRPAVEASAARGGERREPPAEDEGRRRHH